MSARPVLQVILDGDGCWPDLDLLDPKVHRATVITLAALPGGMASGAPSVTVRVDLEDGAIVLAQTSLELLLSAAEAFKAAHGDPRAMTAGEPQRADAAARTAEGDPERLVALRDGWRALALALANVERSYRAGFTSPPLGVLDAVARAKDELRALGISPEGEG